MSEMNQDLEVCEKIESILVEASQQEKKLACEFQYNMANTHFVNKKREIQKDCYDSLRRLEIIVEVDKEKHELIINCFAFVLKLMYSKRYRELVELECGFNGVKPEFINWIIENNFLQQTSHFEGCIVVYFNEKNWSVHAAILVKSGTHESEMIVQDRWGDYEATFTHKLNHVADPNWIKKEKRYYSPLTQLQSEKLLEKYIKEKEVLTSGV